MNEFISWHKNVNGEAVVKALAKNNFTATYVNTRQEAIDHVLTLISPNATIGVGGSWTVGELGLVTLLEQQGHTIFNHGKPGLNADEAQEMRIKELTCDVFLTSSNAITLDGKLVNTDGTGNRVAAMIFGPKKVIVLAGINKIVKDVAAAEERIQLLAAPINNKRLSLNNPCATTGHCMDCQSPSRICNVTTILNRKPGKSDIHIIIIGENLGF